MLVLPNSILCSHVLTRVHYVVANRMIMIGMANIMKLCVVHVRMGKEALIEVVSNEGYWLVSPGHFLSKLWFRALILALQIKKLNVFSKLRIYWNFVTWRIPNSPKTFWPEPKCQLFHFRGEFSFLVARNLMPTLRVFKLYWEHMTNMLPPTHFSSDHNMTIPQICCLRSRHCRKNTPRSSSLCLHFPDYTQTIHLIFLFFWQNIMKLVKM